MELRIELYIDGDQSEISALIDRLQGRKTDTSKEELANGVCDVVTEVSRIASMAAPDDPEIEGIADMFQELADLAPDDRVA